MIPAHFPCALAEPRPERPVNQIDKQTNTILTTENMVKMVLKPVEFHFLVTSDFPFVIIFSQGEANICIPPLSQLPMDSLIEARHFTRTLRRRDHFRRLAEEKGSPVHSSLLG